MVGGCYSVFPESKFHCICLVDKYWRCCSNCYYSILVAYSSHCSCCWTFKKNTSFLLYWVIILYRVISSSLSVLKMMSVSVPTRLSSSANVINSVVWSLIVLLAYIVIVPHNLHYQNIYCLVGCNIYFKYWFSV